ncbi:hypothetical protein N9W89_02245 [Hellea sp.]|nr:hypothetical protein [Hellea sp.]
MTDKSPNELPTTSPRLRRASRYQKQQERMAAQRAADNKLYGAMFAMMSILALLAVLIGALMLYGGNVDVSGMGDLAQPWLGPLTKLEVGGFVFVGLIAVVLYMRMRKK